MWEISRAAGIAFLIGLSVEDIRFRRVSGELLVMMTILGITYHICERDVSWILILCGIGIGIFFVFISYITKEALGYGDSILICILGMFVGAAELIEILILTWMMVAAAAMILLAGKHFSRKAALPFIPFLAIGYSVVSVSGYIGEIAGGVK